MNQMNPKKRGEDNPSLQQQMYWERAGFRKKEGKGRGKIKTKTTVISFAKNDFREKILENPCLVFINYLITKENLNKSLRYKNLRKI